MADVNLQLVREFFELNLCRVLTQWQQAHPRDQAGESGIMLYIENTAPNDAVAPEFVLRPGDISGIHRAIVDVRAWHGDRMYPSVVASNPILTQLVDAGAFAQARTHFGGNDFTSILVVSELPGTADLRARAVTLLQQSGIGHILEFPVVLRDLLDKVSAGTAYPASTTLQLLRILKRYRFIRNLQMEFSFPTEARGVIATPHVETAAEVDEDEEE